MTSTQFTAKNYEYGGHLKTRLREWRAQGKSLRWIADELSRGGVIVRKSTVSNWCEEFQINKGE
jgi:hypothetical protein